MIWLLSKYEFFGSHFEIQGVQLFAFKEKKIPLMHMTIANHHHHY